MSIIDPQKPPVSSSGDVWKLVMADMEERRQFGIAKYGTPVQANNGRDALVDAYQEILDTAVYLRQAIEERNLVRAKIDAMVRSDCVSPDSLRCDVCHWPLASDPAFGCTPGNCSMRSHK